MGAAHAHPNWRDPVLRCGLRHALLDKVERAAVVCAVPRVGVVHAQGLRLGAAALVAAKPNAQHAADFRSSPELIQEGAGRLCRTAQSITPTLLSKLQEARGKGAGTAALC